MWRQGAEDSWNANRQMRELARQARRIQTANWNSKILGDLRVLAENLSDNAIYANMTGDSSNAIEITRDMLRISQLILQSPKGVVPMLVANGIESLAAYQLQCISCNVTLADDPRNNKALQIQGAHILISQLLVQPNPRAEFIDALAHTTPPQGVDLDWYRRLLNTGHRSNTELSFAAMSLACRVFKFENHRWPISLDELVPIYLPHTIIDPWGDGKQTLGYVLIKRGLPDGSDRPLLYSRCESSKGLAFPSDRFEIGFDGWSVRNETGQFRDVLLWGQDPNYDSHTQVLDMGPKFLPLPPDPAPTVKSHSN